uniref:Amino acid transporter transmembrane domain-containing protein n=1 Tax=Timema douglasi TaxID=61478 RepID=A0A7R8ZE02_TIMDO|nr:unnamed protein product [Timema douglasi]
MSAGRTCPAGHQLDHSDLQHNLPREYIESMIHLLKGNIGSGMFAMGDGFHNAGLVVGPLVTLILGVVCVHSQHMLVGIFMSILAVKHCILSTHDVTNFLIGWDGHVIKGTDCGDAVFISKDYADAELTDSVDEINSAWALKARTGADCLPTFADTLELSFKTGPAKFQRFSRGIRHCQIVDKSLRESSHLPEEAELGELTHVMDVYNVTLDVHLHMFIILLPILLSCWVRNLKYLVPISLGANALLAVGVACTLYFITSDLPPVSSRNYVSSWSQFPLFFGTTIYAFEGISLVLPVQHQMKKPRQFAAPLGVLNVGMSFTTLLFICMGFLSYLKYGNDIKGSLTLNLPESDVLSQFIKIAISLGILFSYALQMYVPIDIIWPGLAERFGPFRHPVCMETIFRTMLVLFTYKCRPVFSIALYLKRAKSDYGTDPNNRAVMLLKVDSDTAPFFILAEAIPKLGLFISLIGAVSSTALALLFPAILDLVTFWEDGFGRFHYRLIKNSTIFLIGIVGFATGTYVSMEQIVNAFFV